MPAIQTFGGKKLCFKWIYSKDLTSNDKTAGKQRRVYLWHGQLIKVKETELMFEFVYVPQPQVKYGEEKQRLVKFKRTQTEG